MFAIPVSSVAKGTRIPVEFIPSIARPVKIIVRNQATRGGVVIDPDGTQPSDRKMIATPAEITQTLVNAIGLGKVTQCGIILPPGTN